MKQLNNSKIFCLTYRIVCTIVAIIGVLMIAGVFNNNFKPTSLLFYTVQSNIVVIGMFLFLIYKTIAHKQDNNASKQYGFYPRVSSVISLDIFVTMLVFWFVLTPQMLVAGDTGAMLKFIFGFDNICVHLLTPLFMIFDYIFFNKRGTIKKYDSLYCIIFPYVYLLIVIPLGLAKAINYSSWGSESYYPYFFIDIDQFGWYVLPMVLVLTLFFIGIYVAWQFIDRAIAKKEQKKVENKN